METVDEIDIDTIQNLERRIAKECFSQGIIEIQNNMLSDYHVICLGFIRDIEDMQKKMITEYEEQCKKIDEQYYITRFKKPAK
jgi:hypothetical protein